jgi:hypothetical protein
MKGPYTIQAEEHDGRGGYLAVGEPITAAEVGDARRAVRDITERTGVVPRVTDGSGHAVALFTNEEVARW